MFLWRRVRKRNRVRVTTLRPTLSWSKATTTGRSIRLTATEFLASKCEAPNTLTATQQSGVNVAVAVDVGVEQELPVACGERRCCDGAALWRVACLAALLSAHCYLLAYLSHSSSLLPSPAGTQIKMQILNMVACT